MCPLSLVYIISYFCMFLKFLLSYFLFFYMMKIMRNKKQIHLDKPIVMVGLMGAGKTSIGRALARSLGIPFVDSDKEIEKAAGCSVIDIFSMYGEKEFRRVEEKVIERLIDTAPNIKVISTGEGAFITNSVRQIVLEKALTIWLKADLELLVKRTNFRHTRPQLLNTDSREILAQLIKDRYDTYALADITVETRDENIHKTLSKVLNAIEQYLNKQKQGEQNENRK